jgi:hypothetical protein
MTNTSLAIEEILERECPPVFLSVDALTLIAQQYSAPQKKLDQLEKQGFLIRLRRGIYTFKTKADRFLIAGALYSPSYISYETALSYYGMIPERVEIIYSVAKGRPLEITTPLGSFAYRSQSTELYSGGMSMVFIDENPVLIASKEKALLDTIAHRNLSTHGLTAESVYEFVLQDLRVESKDLLSLSCSKLKKLSFLYRNHAPRKLYDHIVKLKQRKTHE